eukprot:2943894-Pyramimonas_sp.AAC.1
MCSIRNTRLALVIRSAPFLAAQYPQATTGRPANKLAMNANAVRNAVLSEAISRAPRASMYGECRASPCGT